MTQAPIPFPGRRVTPPPPGLWHVSLIVAGSRHDPTEVAAAMHRLGEVSPFLASIRYDDRHAEIAYWDEAEVLDDAAAMALRFWHDNRRDASLPDWQPRSLQVMDRDSYLASGRGEPSAVITGDVRPF